MMPRVHAGIEARTFSIVDRVTVTDIPPAAEKVSIWHPLIPDSPDQQILDMAVETDVAYSVGHEPEHGNFMMHIEVPGETGEFSYQVHYQVRRVSQEHSLDVGSLPISQSNLLLARFLQPERYVDVTQESGIWP